MHQSSDFMLEILIVLIALNSALMLRASALFQLCGRDNEV